MLDRDEKLQFMRARGRMNFMITDFMHHYAASKDARNDPSNYAEDWRWLFGLPDPHRAEMLGGILTIFGNYMVTGNFKEDWDRTNQAINELQTLFSISQMTTTLGKPHALGA